MKWKVALLIAAVFTMGCTVTVKPLAQSKPVKRSYSSRHHRASRSPDKRSSTPPQQSAPNIKETWWIENYKKLEAAHGDYQIYDDAKIEPLPDGRFKVPDTVLSHYQDMLLAKPTPKP